jgi:hypothetical protein
MDANIESVLEKDINVIKNSLLVQRFNVIVPDTSTFPNTSIPSTLVDQNGDSLSVYLGQSSLLLHSLAITYDSTFQANYSIYTKLQGLNIDNNKFNIPPASTSGFDYVPPSKSFLIPSNQTLNIYAYNSNGASSSGTFNVLAIFEKLDTL